MEILLGLIVLAAVAFILPNLLSSKKTKLFRRIWSSEKAGGAYGSAKQSEAFAKLLTEFRVDFQDNDEVIKARIGDLLADATRFDLRHQRNMGVQVMPVLARHLSSHPELRGKPEITEDLAAMTSLDGVAMYRALRSSVGITP